MGVISIIAVQDKYHCNYAKAYLALACVHTVYF